MRFKITTFQVPGLDALTTNILLSYKVKAQEAIWRAGSKFDYEG